MDEVNDFSYLTVDGQAFTSSRRLVRAILTASSDIATVILHDGTGTGDPIVATIKAPINDTKVVEFNVRTANGIFVNLSGTTPELTIVFA